jgi:uncharacterized protein DUF4296
MLTAIACNNSKNNGDIMSQDAMVNYLIDLHIAEAHIQNLRLKKDSSVFVFKIYEKHLLEKNGLSDSLFIRSYSHYLKKPEELEKIYEAVIDSISVRKSIDDVVR